MRQSTYAPLADEQPPSIRKPSQAYVDNYIARRGDSGGGSTPSTRALATPLATTTTAPPLEPLGRSGRQHMPRIFYKLDKECPAQYYPTFNTAPSSLRAIRCLLLFLCSVQLAAAFAALYATAVSHYLHDAYAELFTEAVAALCAFAACAGFVGVCASSRPMLLVLYVNQLWCLSNVSTYAVVHMTSEAQGDAACRLYRTGELSKQQLEGLDCDALDANARYALFLLGGLVGLLWVVCLLSRMYNEMLQDVANDAMDRQLVNFVWQRRGETWAKLEKFEDVVQRQFEELRMSLVAHAHHAQGVRHQTTAPSLMTPASLMTSANTPAGAAAATPLATGGAAAGAAAPLRP